MNHYVRQLQAWSQLIPIPARVVLPRKPFNCDFNPGTSTSAFQTTIVFVFWARTCHLLQQPIKIIVEFQETNSRANHHRNTTRMPDASTVYKMIFEIYVYICVYIYDYINSWLNYHPGHWSKWAQSGRSPSCQLYQPSQLWPQRRAVSSRRPGQWKGSSVGKAVVIPTRCTGKEGFDQSHPHNIS